jgi:hypothetical protein
VMNNRALFGLDRTPFSQGLNRNEEFLNLLTHYQTLSSLDNIWFGDGESNNHTNKARKMNDDRAARMALCLDYKNCGILDIL